MTSFNRNINYWAATIGGTPAAFATALSDALIGAGWVLTSDTGQTAAASMAVGGYHIFKMNDSLAATVPVFIKIDYYNSSWQSYPSYGNCSFGVTVGAGSNGSGTITNGCQRVTFTSRSFNSNNGYNLPQSSWISADSVSLNVFLWQSTSGHQLFSIERTRDLTGVVTAGGFTFMGYGINDNANGAVNTAGFTYLQVAGGSARKIQTQWMHFLPSIDSSHGGGYSTLMSGNNVRFIPLHCFSVEGNSSPIGFIEYFNSDLPINNIITLTLNGVSYNYLPLSDTGPNGRSLAMRWI
jgi:hypothetical protein